MLKFLIVILALGFGSYMSILSDSCSRKIEIENKIKCSELKKNCLEEGIKPYECKILLRQDACFE